MMYTLLIAVSYLSTKFVGLERTVAFFQRLGEKFRRAPSKCVQDPDALYRSVTKGYRWVPFAIRCLDQAVVTWFVLNINRHPATLKIGVTLSPLASHAWVELGEKIYVQSYLIEDMEVLANYPTWNQPISA